MPGKATHTMMTRMKKMEVIQELDSQGEDEFVTSTILMCAHILANSKVWLSFSRLFFANDLALF